MIGWMYIGEAIRKAIADSQKRDYALYESVCKQVNIPCCSMVEFLAAQKAMKL